MNKKLRTILFIALAIIFLAISPAIIFYSQGYRFDFQEKKLLLTGGIYIKASQPAANVYIDNKYADKTGQLLSFDFLAQNLLPNKHSVRIEKSGYRTWQKNLLVKEKMVTQAYVVLFPEKIDFTQVDANIQHIYSFPGSNKIFVSDAKNQLFSYESGQKTLIVGNIAKTISKILDISVSADTSKIILKAIEKSTGKTKFYLLATDKEAIALTALKTLDKNTGPIYFYSNNIIYFTLSGKIYKQALDSQKTTLITSEAISAFTLQGDNLYFLRNGVVFRQNIITGNAETLVKEPLAINPKSSYEIFTYWGKIFILENKKILSVVTDEQQIKTLIKSTSEIKYSGFSDKLMFYNNASLWLYLLKDYESPFFAKAGSLIPFVDYKKINGFEWLGGEYFVVIDENNNSIISEVDNRDKINSFQANADNSQIWFDQANKQLYALSQNNLLASPKLIP
ncbi:MAG: PEGA domain-containing protein [Candidatus Paceibacterota bacterium]